MEEQIGALIIAVVGGATIAALLALLVILLPNVTSKTARTIEAMPGRSFILGAINFTFFFAVAFVFAQIGDGVGGFFGGLFSIISLIIAFILLLLLSLGWATLVRLVSERTGESKPFSGGRLYRSAVLLVGAMLAPLAGWFILTPLALFIGLGAMIITMVQGVGGRFSSRPNE